MPPQIDESAVTNYVITTAIQCGEVKNAVELEIIAQRVLKLVAFLSRGTQYNIIILKAKMNTTRNLLIRSVTYEILTLTLTLTVG